MSFCCDKKFFETIISNPENFSEELQQKAFTEIKEKISCEFCKEDIEEYSQNKTEND